MTTSILPPRPHKCLHLLLVEAMEDTSNREYLGFPYLHTANNASFFLLNERKSVIFGTFNTS